MYIHTFVHMDSIIIINWPSQRSYTRLPSQSVPSLYVCFLENTTTFLNSFSKTIFSE